MTDEASCEWCGNAPGVVEEHVETRRVRSAGGGIIPVKIRLMVCRHCAERMVRERDEAAARAAAKAAAPR